MNIRTLSFAITIAILLGPTLCETAHGQWQYAPSCQSGHCNYARDLDGVHVYCPDGRCPFEYGMERSGYRSESSHLYDQPCCSGGGDCFGSNCSKYFGYQQFDSNRTPATICPYEQRMQEYYRAYTRNDLPRNGAQSYFPEPSSYDYGQRGTFVSPFENDGDLPPIPAQRRPELPSPVLDSPPRTVYGNVVPAQPTGDFQLVPPTRTELDPPFLPPGAGATSRFQNEWEAVQRDTRSSGPISSGSANGQCEHGGCMHDH